MNVDYLYKVVNGNYLLKIYDNNIRVRETEDDILRPEYPEIYNIVINEFNVYGYLKYADILNYEFIKDILLFSNINIYGYDILIHPQLEEFINILKEKKCYIKLYINQDILTQSKIKRMNDLYENNKEIKEIHINVNNINKPLLNILDKYNYLYIDIMSHDFSFNKIKKLKDYNLIIKSCDNKFIINKSKIYHKKEMLKNIDYIINNFKLVKFDNNGLIYFKLKDYLKKDNIKLVNNNSFTITFDLINNVYYKTFNSNIKYPINNNLKNMFEILKNS